MAAADGKKAALSISSMAPVSFAAQKASLKKTGKKLSLADYQRKSAKRVYEEYPLEMTVKNAQKEAQRCLLCGDICNVCVTVCPNRANVSYTIEPKEYSLQKAVKQDGKIEIIDDEPFIIPRREKPL